MLIWRLKYLYKFCDVYLITTKIFSEFIYNQCNTFLCYRTQVNIGPGKLLFVLKNVSFTPLIAISKRTGQNSKEPFDT